MTTLAETVAFRKGEENAIRLIGERLEAYADSIIAGNSLLIGEPDCDAKLNMFHATSIANALALKTWVRFELLRRNGAVGKAVAEG